MAPQEHVKKVENIIGYTFSSACYIQQAITAAGVEDENYDGNRKLSQIGASLVETVLAVIVYGTGASRGENMALMAETEAMNVTDGSQGSTANLRRDFTNKEHYAAVARRTGIVDCIGYNRRQRAPSPAVLRIAVNAIIAAVFLDTWNVKLTLGVILRVFAEGNGGYNFRMLSPTSMPAAAAFSSGVDQILACWTGNMLQTDEQTSGETTSYNGTLPDLQLETPATLLSAPTTGPIGAEQGLVNSIPAVNVPRSSSLLYPDHWALPPTPELGLHTSSLFDEFFQLPGSTEAIGTSAEERMTLATNLELSDQLSVNYGHPNPSLSTRSSCLDTMDRNLSQNTSGCKRAVESRRSSRKRRRSTENPSLPPGNDRLQRYLFQERQKCESEGLPPPQDTYFNLDVQRTLYSLESKHFDVLATALITVASSRSILALRDIICSERTHRSLQSCCLRDGILPKERFGIIRKLDQKSAFIKLVKWCHTLELFKESGGPEARSSTGYVITTSASFEHQTKSFGNPGNQDDSNVARSMMKDIFPDMLPTMEEYQRKLSVIKGMRKLGKRLHILALKFGRGVFGLMLDCSPTSNRMTFSDDIISKTNETTFEIFVDLLEVSQGEALRKFSRAVSPLQDSITYSTLQQSGLFELEKIDSQDILSQAKGSDRLLRLIC